MGLSQYAPFCIDKKLDEEGKALHTNDINCKYSILARRTKNINPYYLDFGYLKTKSIALGSSINSVIIPVKATYRD